jgi:hypothetical protein
VCETSQMCVLLKLHRIVQASAVATRLTARILGARTRHRHGIRNTCARQIRGVVVAAVVDEMRRAPWILKQALELSACVSACRCVHAIRADTR